MPAREREKKKQLAACSRDKCNFIQQWKQVKDVEREQKYSNKSKKNEEKHWRKWEKITVKSKKTKNWKKEKKPETMQWKSGPKFIDGNDKHETLWLCAFQWIFCCTAHFSLSRSTNNFCVQFSLSAFVPTAAARLWRALCGGEGKLYVFYALELCAIVVTDSETATERKRFIIISV